MQKATYFVGGLAPNKTSPIEASAAAKILLRSKLAHHAAFERAHYAWCLSLRLKNPAKNFFDFVKISTQF